MRVETLEEALARLGLTQEMLKERLIRLNALHEEATRLIDNADSSTVDGYDYGYLARRGFHWVTYRGRCYPVKEGSKRYMSNVANANRLTQIEEEIRQIDATYNPEFQVIVIVRKRLQTEWSDENDDTHTLISI